MTGDPISNVIHLSASDDPFPLRVLAMLLHLSQTNVIDDRSISMSDSVLCKSNS